MIYHKIKGFSFELHFCYAHFFYPFKLPNFCFSHLVIFCAYADMACVVWHAKWIVDLPSMLGDMLSGLLM